MKYSSLLVYLKFWKTKIKIEIFIAATWSWSTERRREWSWHIRAARPVKLAKYDESSCRGRTTWTFCSLARCASSGATIDCTLTVSSLILWNYRAGGKSFIYPFFVREPFIILNSVYYLLKSDGLLSQTLNLLVWFFC